MVSGVTWALRYKKMEVKKIYVLCIHWKLIFTPIGSATQEELWEK